MQSLTGSILRRDQASLERRVLPQVSRIAAVLFWTGFTIVMLGLLGALISWFSISGTAARAANAVGTGIMEVGRDAGFTVQKVTLSGRRETTQTEVMEAVNVTVGDSMFGADLGGLSDELAKAGWIETVSVTRFWPDHLHIEVHERTPFALWQRDGAIALIDRHGVVIADRNIERFAHLPLLVGKRANEHASEILAMIALEPALMSEVRSATFVGMRRWNIRMDSGLDIKLPETGMRDAWHKLADLESRFGLLLRDLEAIDLRLSDRTIVKLPAGTVRRERRGGQST